MGEWILFAAVVAAAAVAGVLRWKNGRFSEVTDATDAPDDAAGTTAGARLTAEDLGVALGDRATLVQFSSAFCAPCRATRVVLGQVVDLVPGVSTVEIDAERDLDLVRRLGVLRTPTVLVLDATGAVVSRASGAPTRDQVLVAVERALG